jgi:hypothetical protein
MLNDNDLLEMAAPSFIIDGDFEDAGDEAPTH